MVLQIEYAEGTAPDLSEMLPARPPEWQAAALVPGRLTPIADLGAEAVVANTHYFRKDVNFLLPEDWLLLASQKAEFTIHYGFSADLPEGALFLVKINEQTIRLLPLDRAGGKVQPPLDISFRASFLNPGMNTLTFEMSVPGDPPDLPCTPRVTDMLAILGDSTLNVPPSPKMRQSSVARSLAHLGGADVKIPEEVAVGARDAETLLAFGAQFRPLAINGTKPTLHIVRLDGVGLVPTGGTGVTRRMLQNAVYPSVALPVEAVPAAVDAAASPAFSFATEQGIAAPADPVAAVDDRSAWQSVGRFFSVRGLLSSDEVGIGDLSLTGALPLARWLEGKSGQAILLQLDPETPDEIWLIAGPDITMSDLAKQVDRYRRSTRPQAHEQAALLQDDGNWVTWSQGRRPELLEPLGPGNLRAVLGNYASWSPLIFTGLTLLFALLSVIPAMLFVLLTRRSGSRT